MELQKTPVSFSTIEMQNQNQWHHVHMIFLVLWAIYRFIARNCDWFILLFSPAVIGWSELLWFWFSNNHLKTALMYFLCTIQDIDMYYDVTDTPAMARTSNLNEELGQVSMNKLNLCCGLMGHWCTHDTVTPITWTPATEVRLIQENMFFL